MGLNEANDSWHVVYSKRIRTKGVYFGTSGISTFVPFIEYID